MLSRVADNLYWMSRYLERAEHTARLVDVHLDLALDQSGGHIPGARWERLSTALHVPPKEDLKLEEYSMTQRLAFDQSNLNSIVVCIANARENARQVREKISTEMWLQLNTLYLDIRRTSIDSIWNEQPHLFFMSIKNGAHLFQGITDTLGPQTRFDWYHVDGFDAYNASRWGHTGNQATETIPGQAFSPPGTKQHLSALNQYFVAPNRWAWLSRADNNDISNNDTNSSHTNHSNTKKT